MKDITFWTATSERLPTLPVSMPGCMLSPAWLSTDCSSEWQRWDSSAKMAELYRSSADWNCGIAAMFGTSLTTMIRRRALSVWIVLFLACVPGAMAQSPENVSIHVHPDHPEIGKHTSELQSRPHLVC